tara:strand:- start:344 stop:787 length:444 start_codon:yes stop_codon:yes gene_type:complete
MIPMKINEFVKKHKINNIYSYHQSEVKDGRIEYGWKNSDHLDLDGPIVVTYQSKSKKISDKDLEWSKLEGKNAANLSCYLNYFFASTRMNPEDFISRWSGKEDELSSLNAFDENRGDEGSFMIDLAKFLKDGGKMVRYGRIFKMINN